MAFELPALPYPKDSLQPIMSAETLDYHHGKHHQAYVTNLNNLVKGTPFEGKALEEIVLNSEGTIFNNAGQHWNHSFYWLCFSPNGGDPQGELMKSIESAFGSYDQFKTKFIDEGKKHFGSGWVWLVRKDGQLSIQSTHDGDTAHKHKWEPLMVCDLWEHAYYIDYRNDRAKFLDSVFKKFNWSFISQQLDPKTQWKAPRG
jgi:Fe-Mn family superoxide dismutase